MWSDSCRKNMLAFLILSFILIGRGLPAAPLNRYDDGAAELELLFDPSVFKQHISFTDDYGERPPPPPLPPPSNPGTPYQPNLEDEYY